MCLFARGGGGGKGLKGELFWQGLKPGSEWLCERCWGEANKGYLGRRLLCDREGYVDMKGESRPEQLTIYERNLHSKRVRREEPPLGISAKNTVKALGARKSREF